jgi:hypothetical protein
MAYLPLCVELIASIGNHPGLDMALTDKGKGIAGQIFLWAANVMPRV